MLETKFHGADGAELARQVLGSLEAHAIAPSPRNYELWAAYCLDVLPDLTREIAALQDRQAAFTELALEELFERHLATRLSETLAEASDGIARQLTEALTSLRGAAESAGDYRTQLQSASGQMEAGLDAASLRAIVDRLNAATQTMLARNQALEQRMEASARDVDGLQTMLQAARHEALTDGLTGLANRKHFDEELSRQMRNAAAGNQPLALILCDIDYFKRVNDTWGHGIGDSVIRLVASVLKRTAASEALAARYGGEEFALLLPGASLRDAHQLAETIRQTLKAQKPKRKSTGESLGAITLSFGVAEWRRDETAATLIERADACLYASKRTGRDRVTSTPETCAA